MSAGRERRAARVGLARRGAAIAAALGLAFALKVHYQRAGADELRWVLAPTAVAVERLTGAGFEYEPHRGYLSRAHRYEIVPACAGVNFMVVALVSVAFALALAARVPGAPGALVTLAGSALATYVFTIAANATRIAVAMRLHEAQAAFGPLTPDRLHRIVGTVVYFTFLLALFRLAQRAAGGRHARAA